MTEQLKILGDRRVREAVRNTMRLAPVFELASDLPSSFQALLEELDRAEARLKVCSADG